MSKNNNMSDQGLREKVITYMTDFYEKHGKDVFTARELGKRLDHQIGMDARMDDDLTETIEFLLDRGDIIRRYSALSLESKVLLSPYYILPEQIPEMIEDRFGTWFHSEDTEVEEVFIMAKGYDYGQDFDPES